MFVSIKIIFGNQLRLVVLWIPYVLWMSGPPGLFPYLFQTRVNTPVVFSQPHSNHTCTANFCKSINTCNTLNVPVGFGKIYKQEKMWSNLEHPIWFRDRHLYSSHRGVHLIGWEPASSPCLATSLGGGERKTATPMNTKRQGQNLSVYVKEYSLSHGSR